jgi:predicted  nucleic acid-binding Zn-ribbon protein
MNLDLNDSIKLIAGWMGDVKSVYLELEEVQTAFNGELIVVGKEFNTNIEKLTKKIKSDWNNFPQAFKTEFDSKKSKSEADIKKRISELASTISKSNDELAAIEKTQKAALDNLGKQNPTLNDQEEAIKLKIKDAELECKALERQLARYDGIAGWFAGGKVAQLNKQFKVSITNLGKLKVELEKVRALWQASGKKHDESEQKGKSEWVAIQDKLTKDSMEKKNLEDNIEAMSHSGAILEIASSGKSIPSDLKTEFDQLCALKEKTEQFGEGLKKTSSLMALTIGVSQGFANLSKSFMGLKEEQDMHATLPKLTVSFSETSVNFNKCWKDFIPKINDEKKLCDSPKELIVSVENLVKNNLTEKGIEGMFESIGNSIKSATSSWKG